MEGSEEMRWEKRKKALEGSLMSCQELDSIWRYSEAVKEL